MDFSKIRGFLFLGLLTAVTIAFFYLVKPFAYPIFWAAIVAALFNPIYRRLNQYLKHPSLSSIITMSLATVIILLPLSVIGILLFKESVNLYGTINDNQSQITTAIQNTNNYLRSSSYLDKLKIDDIFVSQKVAEASQLILTFIFNSAKQLTQNSITFLVMLIITLYTLFFFMRDGDKFLAKLMYLCPLGDKYEKMLYQKFTETAAAAIKGTLLVGTLQGILAGVLFALTGVQAAVILGIITVLLSIIPGAGSFIVWLPVSLVMIFTGHLWSGIIIIIVGALVISTIDNFLRPVLVGKQLRMHPLIILFSTLGGIALFGLSGFIIGPIISALLLAFWEMYEEYYKNELKHN